MDPDMVRQQEEAEAASRILSSQPQPPLILQRSPQPEMIHAPMEAFSLFPEPPCNTPQRVPTLTAKHSVSLAALYNTVLTGAGLAGGIMTGVKLQLVVLQSLGIQAAAGLVLGGQWTATYLRRRGVPAGSAYRASLSTTAMVLACELTTLALAHRYSAAPPTGNPADATAIYALTMGGGALVAFSLAFIGLRKVLRRKT
jgi:hypothetical protein